jgi:predicted anti-sigma-YlaC factor YlaD
VRERFHEARWAAWNLLRVVTATTAFGLLAWALVVHGRSG